MDRSPDKRKKIGKDETKKYKVAPSTRKARSEKRKYGSSGLTRAITGGNYELLKIMHIYLLICLTNSKFVEEKKTFLI